MPSSCKDIRAALAQCLSESPCVMAGHPASQCLREPLVNDLPTKCQQLKKGYGDCKRGMIDMRKRFRGNKPVGMTTETPENNRYIGGVGSGMLYANLGTKSSTEKRPGEVDYGREEDEQRGATELIPDRFKETTGSLGYASGYRPRPEGAEVALKDPPAKGREREGGGWNWWQG